MKLKNRKAIVTGGGRGIGRAYVERFLAEGASVAILDLDMENAQKTAEELSSQGEVFAIKTDVADEQSVQTSVDAAAERLGGIDILINNAALYGDWKPQDDTYPYLRKIVDVNMLSLWLMTRAAAPYLTKSGHGRVINISSGAAYNYNYQGPTDEFPGLRSYGYSWTKWNVIGLTKYSAAQLGNWNVTVNAIAPGVTLTEATTKSVDPKRIEQLMNAQPIKGAMHAEDMTGAALFFASDDSRFITGQVLVIDGGRHMPA